jgi:hypothetical protein
MAGRHSKRGARARIPEQRKPYRPSIELVDARTKQAHLLTLTAYEAGFDPHVAYVALCGAEVLPACLAEPGQLRAVPVPDQPRQVSNHHSQEVEAAVVVAMTWFWVSAGKQGTHHGVLDGGTVRAECGATFPASAAVQLNSPRVSVPPIRSRSARNAGSSWTPDERL